MLKPDKTCQCCGRTFAPAVNFTRIGADLSPICIHCESLTPLTASNLTLLTAKINSSMRISSVAQRRAERTSAKLALYRANGKRCTACHAYKPVEAYHKCATGAGGLQPTCKACIALHTTLVKQGGRALWLSVRDGLRAAAGKNDLQQVGAQRHNLP